MPNRLDIELTSIRSDGSYTWRAAGARQPKGVIDAKVLAENAKVGDVLRVEAEVEIDGITILGVLPPKEKAAPAGRIELIGSPKPVQAVTTVLLSEGGRGGDRRDLLDSPRRGGGSGSRDRRPARGAERPDGRRPQPGGGADAAVERRPRAEAEPASGSPRPAERRPGAPGGERRPERRPRSDGAPIGGSPRSAEGAERRPERRPRPAGAPAGDSPRAEGGERRPRPSSSTRRPGSPAGERSPADAASRAAQAPAARRTPPRFEPGTAHRDLLFASLASEEKPIAERLAAGGIPAVRRAIAAERERARSEGRPEVTGEAILAIAEQLATSVKQAIWLDRAEAAVAQLEQISLRDLRTTVVAAAPRDEASRDLDRKLREELDRRVKKLRSNWEEQITHALEEGRVLQALRFSAQPPEPTARFPAALVGRLAASAGAAMSSSTPVERWLAVLEAAVSSPIRRQIHPEGLPEDPSGEVVRKARVAAGSVPALAPMLGLPMPPPPKPLPSARPPRPPRPPRPSGRGPRQAAVGPTVAGPEAGTDTGAAQAAEHESTTGAPAPQEDVAARSSASFDEGGTPTPVSTEEDLAEASEEQNPTEVSEPPEDVLERSPGALDDIAMPPEGYVTGSGEIETSGAPAEVPTAASAPTAEVAASRPPMPSLSLPRSPSKSLARPCSALSPTVPCR